MVTDSTLPGAKFSVTMGSSVRRQASSVRVSKGSGGWRLAPGHGVSKSRGI
jgi:hypothetical protein